MGSTPTYSYDTGPVQVQQETSSCWGTPINASMMDALMGFGEGSVV